MKKIISPLFLTAIFLLTTSFVAAQDRKVLDGSEIPVEVVNSSIFSIKTMNLTENKGNLQLQFSIANKSKQSSPGVEIVLSAYNKSGSLKAKHIWLNSEEMSFDSKWSSTFEVGQGLKGAFRYTIEFLVPPDAQPDDACTSCTDNAIRACGAGKVKSVSCEPDSSGIFSCNFECKADELERPNP